MPRLPGDYLQREINCTPSARGRHCSGPNDSRSMSGKYFISARTDGGKIRARNAQCRWQIYLSTREIERKKKWNGGGVKLPRRTTAINNNLFDGARNVCASVMLSKCKTDRNKR